MLYDLKEIINVDDETCSVNINYVTFLTLNSWIRRSLVLQDLINEAEILLSSSAGDLTLRKFYEFQSKGLVEEFGIEENIEKIYMEKILKLNL